MSVGVVAGDDDAGDALEQEHPGQVGDRHLPSGSWPPVIATVPL